MLIALYIEDRPHGGEIKHMNCDQELWCIDGIELRYEIVHIFPLMPLKNVKCLEAERLTSLMQHNEMLQSSFSSH